MKNIFNIAAHLPFLDTLAQGVLNKFGEDPLKLSSVTILLPNRRSCRHLRDAFLRASNGAAMILPNMQPMGDMNDEEIYIKTNSNVVLPPVVSSTQQRLMLARLIQMWQARLSTHEKANESQATHLAIELANFLNDVEKEQLSLDGLEDIVPDDLSSHWQITLKFLRILIDQWPKILKDNNCISIGTQRNVSLQRLSDFWQDYPVQGHIIAAGSTGSIPATRQLLNQISNMENGMVVLAALDCHIDAKQWESIGETHPQYTLKQLLEHMEIDRGDVQRWHGTVSERPELSEFISEMMRSAGTSHHWHNARQTNYESTASIQIAQTQTLQDEACLIALRMKDSLNIQGKTTALITNDTELSRHVSSIMKKWHVDVDNSSGRPLSETPQAVFMRLVAKMAENNTSPVDMLSCLKHPFAAVGFSLHDFRRKIRKIERKALRGIRSSEGLAGVVIILRKNNEPELAKVVENIASIIKPLSSLMLAQKSSLKNMILTHIKVMEQLAETDSESGASRIWAGEDGEALKKFLDEAILAAKTFSESINTSEYLGMIEALMVGQSYRVAYGSHPRLFILTPIESRMLQFDSVILGGMNEGSWPMSAKSDPWMSRPMRLNFGLPCPEKRIGQSAHDFTQLLCCKEVLITRCTKSGGTQTIPSRWILRMEILTQLFCQKEFHKLDEKWLKWAKLLNSSDVVQPCAEPKPKAALGDFPRELSVTSIEKLMRNPYDIYASKIMKLKKLDPLDQDPGAAEFGNLIHNSIDHLMQKYDDLAEGERLNYLLSAGRKELQEKNFSKAIEALWWPKFERIAEEFCNQELECRKDGRKILSEVKGEMRFCADGQNFLLHARADRVEQRGGKISIIDYKTGATAAISAVEQGVSPQMTLEGVIANAGGFGLKGEATSLQYWKLSGGKAPITKIAVKNRKNEETFVPNLIAEADVGLRSLVEYFCKEGAVYLACPNNKTAPRYNDYKHLSRIKEWQE